MTLYVLFVYLQIHSYSNSLSMYYCMSYVLSLQSVTPRTLPKSSPLLRITKPDKVKKGKKKKEAIPDKIRRATSPNSFLFKSSSPTLSLGDRPHSFHVASVAEFDQTLQKRSESLSVSPRMLRRWLVQKSSSGNTAMTRIYYPNSAHSFNPPRLVDTHISLYVVLYTIASESSCFSLMINSWLDL